jgi:hypothetical protein
VTVPSARGGTRTEFGDIQFNKDIFDVDDISTLATPLVDKVNNSFVQAQLWGKNLGVCIVGSNLARDLDAVGGSALIDYALATMESMFGSVRLREEGNKC